MLDDGWVLTNEQLHEAGLTVRDANRLVKAGQAFRPLPRVVSTAVASPEVYARAGLARAGFSASLWASSAARLLLGEELELPVEVAHRRGGALLGNQYIRFHRVADLPDPVMRNGWPVSPPAVVAIGVAQGDLVEDDRRDLATAMLRKGRIHADEVEAEYWRVPMVRRAQVGRLLEELHANAWSPMEAKTWRGQRDALMPMPRLNVRFETSHGRRFVDGYFDGLDAGYEIHGQDHESSWQEDMIRTADLLLEQGVVLLPILALEVKRDLPGVLDQLRIFVRNRSRELGVPMPKHARPPWCARR